MSGIFGVLKRDGAPHALSALESMQRSLAVWGPDGVRIWHNRAVGLGTANLFATAEAANECLPRVKRASGIAFTAAGRLDNRTELAQALDIPPKELDKLSDSELMLEGYLRWQTRAPEHFFGDWAFAAWHPTAHKLFVARDHIGNTSLYYCANSSTIAFAPTCQALIDLNLYPADLDELYLAQVLVSWSAYQGERTVHRHIQCLAPAHTLTITPGRLDVRQYWRLEDTRELNWPRREDYVDAFTSLFDQAVRTRLRAPGAGLVATALSGGLDSSSVAVTAAGILQAENQRLAAFVSVPLTDAGSFAGARLGDEFPFASATAQHAGNIDLRAVLAAGLSPMEAIRRQLEILNQPVFSAANAFWILEMQRCARAGGFLVLLNAHMGKAGMSWRGDLHSQPLGVQLRQLGAKEWLKSHVKAWRSQLAHLPFFSGLRAQLMEQQDWYRSSAIHPNFARRLNLRELWLDDNNELPARTPRERRYQILLPGRSVSGACDAQMGAAHGIEIRDPTADVRLLEFVLSIPDHIFIDPASGTDRWLLREAMKDRLPEQVRLSGRRGRQAADLVPRLRGCTPEVDAALAELDTGPSAEYVDVAYMRQIWQMGGTEDSPEALRKSETVLTRGIMAGLFVNQFSARSPSRSKSAAAGASSLEAVR